MSSSKTNTPVTAEEKTFTQHLAKKENPPDWGWYYTDKGELYFFRDLLQWSCRDDKISEEYPTYWYSRSSLQQELKTAKEENEHHEALWKQGCEIIDIINEDLESKESQLQSYREANERLAEALDKIRLTPFAHAYCFNIADKALQNWKKGDNTNG